MRLLISRLFHMLILTAVVAWPAERGVCAPPAESHVKPEVMALLKQSTDAYKKMKSYSAEISLRTERPGEQGVVIEGHFVLALDRANRFCYRDMSDPVGTAAVCNGKRFVNYKRDLNQYTDLPAPADYKGINIVDDVTFEPIATYIIALMLQGDVLADKDIKESMLKATIGAPVVENGKKLQVLHFPFGTDPESCDVFISEDHLIIKSTTKIQAKDAAILQTEQLTNIKVDKPVDSAIFLYSPPANAQKVERFTAPQRAGDAMLTPEPKGHTVLAAYSGPPIKQLSPAVKSLIDQATAAYGKLSSYRHVAVFRARGTQGGKAVDQSAKFTLAMVRPNKLAFKMISKPAVAAVSDGKTFIDFRSGEYVESAAPADISGIPLQQDDFDPVAGSYLIALLLQDKAYKDPKLLGILLKASAQTGIVADSKKWDALDFPLDGIKFVLYFDPNTHLLAWAAARVPDQDIVLTETFEQIETNKSIPDSEFTFAIPATAKKVNKL